MTGAWAWPVAALLLLLFRVWYDNWRGPLRPAEIERYLARAAQLPGAEHTDLDDLRAFLTSDDGREFLMVNLVRLNPQSVPDPATGTLVPARTLLQGYLRGFMPALLRRGGHPVLVVRKVGGYIDAWQVAPDPGWTLVGLMRYRSRRDLMALATDPRFLAAYPLKRLAISQTFSFPAQRFMSGLGSPRSAVALALALAAALVHLAVLLF